MDINHKAPVKKFDKIFIKTDTQKIWEVLTDINQWAGWHEKISRSELEQDLLEPGTKFKWTINGTTIVSTLHTVKPYEAFGWSGVTFGGSAIHNWYLKPDDSGTMVSVEESMQGWLIALFKRKMNRDLAKDMRYWLTRLKAESEK